MLTTSQSLILIAILAAVTFFTRAVPFLLFPDKDRLPPVVRYLGQALPYSIMAMLVVYCYRNVKITSVVFGAPEFICALVILVLHRWKHNLILSIAAGTLLYMALVQTVF